MQDQQYDVSPEMLKLFRKKEMEREASKKYYQNLVRNPYRPTNDVLPPETNFYRYHSMSCYHAEIWQPSLKSKMAGWLFFGSAFLYFIYVSKERDEREKKLRSGVMNLSNRPFPCLL